MNTEESVTITKDLSKKRSSSYIEKIIFWLVSAVLFLIPIIIIPNFVAPLYPAKVAIFYWGTFAAAGLWIFGSFRSGVFKFTRNGVFYPLLLMLVVWLASSSFSLNIKNSIFGKAGNIETFFSLLALSLLMFLVSVSFKNEKRIFAFFSAIFISAAIAFIYQVAHVFFGINIMQTGALVPKTANLIGKWNDFSIFFGLIGILSIIFSGSLQFGKLVKVILIAAIIVSAVSLVFTNFLLNSIIFGSVALIILIINLLFGGGKNKFDGLIVPGFFVAMVVFLFFFRSIGGGWVTSAGLDTSEVRPSLSSTLNIAKEISKEGVLHAVIGNGPNTFSNLWDKMKPISVNQTIFWNTNFPSGISHAGTLLATTGILGGLSMLFFGIMLARHLLITLRNGFARDDFLAVAGKASAFGSFYLWLMVMMYSPGYVIMIMAFALTGISISVFNLINKKNEIKVAIPSGKYSFFVNGIMVVSIIGCATIFLWHSSIFAAVIYYGNGVKTFNVAGDINAAESKLRKASALDKMQDEYSRTLSEVELVKLNSGIYKPGVSEEENIKFGETLNLGINSARSAISADKLNMANWIQLGTIYESAALYGIENAEEMAIESYAEASKVSPLNPMPFFMAAKLKFLLGNNEEAKQYIDYALSLKPDFASALYLASQIQIKEGSVKEALASMTRAAVASPADVGLHFQLGVLSYQNKDLETAKLALERAVTLNPLYANAKYFLGLVYAQQGLYEQALDQFYGILETNPENKDVEKIIKNILNSKPALIGVGGSSGANPPIPDQDDSLLEQANDESESEKAKE